MEAPTGLREKDASPKQNFLCKQWEKYKALERRKKVKVRIFTCVIVYLGLCIILFFVVGGLTNCYWTITKGLPFIYGAVLLYIFKIPLLPSKEEFKSYNWIILFGALLSSYGLYSSLIDVFQNGFASCHNQIVSQQIALTIAINDLTPNRYLPLEKAKITLRYDDKSETQEVNEKATFTGIPRNFWGEYIDINFQSQGFTAIDTSLKLSNNHIILPVKRNDAFSKIFGIVKEARSGNRLKGVTISVQDIVTKTDSQGIFNLFIPIEKQREKQRVRAYKKGYHDWDRIEPVIEDVETIIHLKETIK